MLRSVLAFHNSVQEQVAQHHSRASRRDFSGQVTSHADYYDLRWGEIQRLGIAGFVTETNGCCIDLADEISK
jgi:hypothetical protein